jgi:dipeptidyl aminopeptidase/acylaminoacyl peptidase
MENPKKSRRLVRRLLWATLIIVLVIVAAVSGIAGYAAYSMTTTARIPITQTPAEFGIKFTDIAFLSTDGLALRGWWLESDQSRSVIIMVHGSDINRADPSIKMLDIAAQLVSHGNNVLMFDLRGHGESAGGHVSAGYFEKRDVLGAVNYARQMGMNEIGVLGYSMGAASSLMAAAESPDIIAVVADSSYADLEEIINYQFSRRSSLPRFFIPIILFMDKTFYGIDFKTVKPVESVKSTACPVFIIVGGQDDTVTTDQAQRLFQASRNTQSQLWIVPEAKHTGSYIARPQEYIERVEAFFDAALK